VSRARRRLGPDRGGRGHRGCGDDGGHRGSFRILDGSFSVLSSSEGRRRRSARRVRRPGRASRR
jgi:hypothetical protein